MERLRKKCIKEGHELVFFDPAHQIHNSCNGKAWQFKGSKGTKKIKANTGRKRINILGCVNAITKKVTTLITEENCDKCTVTKFLSKLRRQYRGKKKIYMILDNARYNRSPVVMAKAKACNIELIYLPAYCPNLNLIERLWKFFKKIVVQNKYYEKFENFEKAIIQFFENIQKYKGELKSLLNFKFGIIKAI